MSNITSTLFITPPQIDPAEYLGAEEARKIADVQITSPASQWSDEVMQVLMRDHPYIPADKAVINFQRTNEPGGAAAGYVGIQGAPRISIPIIIHRRMLKPLDIMLVRGEDLEDPNASSETLPLSEKSFTSMMDVGDTGEITEDKDIHGTGWSESGAEIRAPFRGRYSYASVLGATAEQKTALKKVIQESKAAQAGFMMSDHQVLAHWYDAPEPRQSIQNKIASTGVRVGEAKFASHLPEERGTADFLAAPIFMGDACQLKVAAAANCVNLANPVDIDRVLMFEDGTFCDAPQKVATADLGMSEHSMAMQVKDALAPTRLPLVGEYISFNMGDALTTPAKVASITVDNASNHIQMKLTGALGESIPVYLSPAVKVAKLDTTGSWIFPLHAETFILEKHSNELPSGMSRVASLSEKAVPDSLHYAGGQFTLNVAGRDLGIKQASEDETRRVLDTWFTNGEEMIAHAKQAAAQNIDGAGSVRFASNVLPTIEAVEKTASILDKYPEECRAAIGDLAMPLDKAVKLAAAIASPESADAILGTGMLTEDNLAEFIGLSDEFREVIKKLARLLLYIRMGHPYGDETATIVAMKALQRVADRLDSLSSMLQVG